MFLKHNKWALLWAMLIFILCMIPGHDLPKISWLENFGFDKVVHAGLFFVLAVLLVHGFSEQQSFSSLRNSPKIIALLICIPYGGALELLQGALFIERTADVYDFIANSFGSLAGLLCFNAINEKILSKFIR